MRRIITVLSVTALMAVMLVAGSGYAFAKAFIPDFGGPATFSEAGIEHSA